ncbi:hypothetical protein [Chryseobacterium sp. JUb7]|uniref:hypothetical protein n=1 Tax=Chryseobacterium sp. JUb7 TaxID=2940599 RepID=UPI0021683C94|nr:hypothetical protein [Chryseobacterium sp. JUb7]MCS3531925.1 hypothetical protein [Chryseobacterium sp. JUb7]
MTKKLFLIALILTYIPFFSQVGINTQSPHPSSVLDVTSDTKGILLPRLATASVNNLSQSASEGLIVFDKDLKTFMGWDGTKWINLGYEEINTVPTATNLSSGGSFSTGSALTANYTFSDVQSNPDDASAFIWKRADNAGGANTAIITSATSQNYTLTGADQSKFIQFCVTPGSSVGASPGTQKCSAWGGPVTANQAPTASGVNISGTLSTGQVLTGNYTYSDAEGNTEGTSTYKWTRADNSAGLNETSISGATAKTYILTAGDVNKYIKFYVTPVASSGTTTGTETGSGFAGSIAQAPVALGTWDTTPLSGGTANFGPSPWAGTPASGIQTARIIRDTGATQSGSGSSGAWGSDGLNSGNQAAAETANKTWIFEFVPQSGKSISLTSIDALAFRKSATGPKGGQYQYKVGSGSWTDISGASISGISGGSALTVNQASIDLSGIAALQNVTADTTVSIRLVLWGATATGGTAYMGYQNQQITIKGYAQ